MSDVINLFTKFTLTDIILFTCLLIAAVKGIADVVQWILGEKNKVVKAEIEKEQADRETEKRFEKIESSILKVSQNQEKIEGNLTSMKEDIKLLISSDKDDIKSFLTREHHYFMRLGWIDDYSLQCCQRRYEHYKQENGNSFIAGFMDDIRELPNLPPQTAPVSPYIPAAMEHKK